MRVCPKCQLQYRDASTLCAEDGTPLEEGHDPCIGKLVGGRYLIERVLGEGGMATVYAARHTLIERPLAVKVLHMHLAHDATLHERFVREARSAATPSRMRT